jgi:hypothetical protein
MSSDHQPLIPLSKCLFNRNCDSNTLGISDKCFDTYTRRYKHELNYDYKKNYSVDTKLIALVEELGLGECGALLAFQFVPEELKEYIEVGWRVGERIVNINYDKAYADILRKQIVDFESGKVSDGLLIYKHYYRFNYIKEKYDELMTQANDDNVYKPPFRLHFKTTFS